MKHAVTIVIWADAAGGVRQGWRPVHEAADGSSTVYCVASGSVIKETKKTLTIAPHCAFEADGSVGQVDGEIAIPRGWIIARRTVTVEIPEKPE